MPASDDGGSASGRGRPFNWLWTAARRRRLSSRGTRGGSSVDDQAGDPLPAAPAGHAGLVGVDGEPLPLDDPTGRAQDRPEPWVALVAPGEAEGQVVGVSGVT